VSMSEGREPVAPGLTTPSQFSALSLVFVPDCSGFRVEGLGISV
jgi:hypothetical protein